LAQFPRSFVYRHHLQFIFAELGFESLVCWFGFGKCRWNS